MARPFRLLSWQAQARVCDPSRAWPLKGPYPATATRGCRAPQSLASKLQIECDPVGPHTPHCAQANPRNPSHPIRALKSTRQKNILRGPAFVLTESEASSKARNKSCSQSLVFPPFRLTSDRLSQTVHGPVALSVKGFASRASAALDGQHTPSPAAAAL